MKNIMIVFATMILATESVWCGDETSTKGSLLWSMAFGAGSGGVAGYTQNQGLNESASYAFDLQFGYAMNDFMYLCLDLAAVPQVDFAWPGSTIDYVNYSAGITFFPVSRFYLRLGPSMGFLEGAEEFGLQEHELGLGFMAGAGVELKMLKLSDKGTVSFIAGAQYFYHNHRGFYTQSNLITAGAMLSLDLGKLLEKLKKKEN